MQKEMSQRWRAAGTQASDEVPFGIRAIEKGVEVEGVWISRGNTPEPVSRGSSAGSSIWEHVPRKTYEVDLEKQDLHPGHDRTASNSTTGTSKPVRSSFDRAVSAEQLPSSHASRDSSPDAAIARPRRSRHPPMTYIRYSCNPCLIRESSTFSAFEGLEAIHRASISIKAVEAEGSTDSTSSSHKSSNSTSDDEPISASAPMLLMGQPRPRPRTRQQSSDLDLLNSHRISQAAETGQLTPRARRPGQSKSVDLNRAVRPRSAFTLSERLDYFGANARPSSSGEGSSPTSTSPKLGALPPSIRRSSMPDVTPFAQFCQSTPRPSSSRGNSIESMIDSRPNSVDSQSIYESAPSSPIMLMSEGAAELKLPPLKRMSFERTAPEIMRGHGSGFEILRPGSLNPPLPKEHPMERQKAAPPVSLHNSSRPRSSSADSRRKLQKKRRPSVGSATGSDECRRSRASGLW